MLSDKVLKAYADIYGTENKECLLNEKRHIVKAIAGAERAKDFNFVEELKTELAKIEETTCKNCMTGKCDIEGYCPYEIK